MLQRFELWRNGWRVFKKHPLLGTGTGDVVDECHKQLIIDASPLMGTKKHVHNQYLTFLVAFGIIGCGLLVFMFCRAVPALHGQSTILVAWLLVILISCISENTLGTLAGILFCSWFLAFRNKS